MSQDLFADERFAEHDAFPDMLYGHVDHIFCGNVTARQAGEALVLELLHLVDKAFALLTDYVINRYPHVVEKQLGGIAAAHPELV
jgi:LmbE family N-acetylglucosaminyl deacetylase